ncbi:methyltransferase domain-containing protein [Pseudoruegeria sp. SHC-113]|uniref:methyltransferase domain-containing protein n=1 Tax=Pseudoruegeria sp. SHC-113 TaxID=2855439 RepID=UPI0021BB6DD3|nr:methyltransferase domain-containing protein [Pseudoruegeria sp. SHC-113]MCT8160397.1 methyltransferase domain-containing protein [Pseudoruegeria sp. SHC-113]
MADPFQDVDAAGPEFIRVFADSMEVRQADPVMEAVVAAYLDRLGTVAPGERLIEIGAGAGAVTRRIAARFPQAEVTGYEPSEGFVAEARARTGSHANLAFTAANGADLPLEPASVDVAVMHTVLTHVTAPEALLAEAFRVLKPGGWLVACDVDFSKAALASFANDPLDACARAFVAEFVTDPFIVGKLRGLMRGAGFALTHFGVDSRVVVTPQQMLPWVEQTARLMEARGQIGTALADALITEHDRRAEDGALYGYQAIGTAIARKP